MSSSLAVALVLLNGITNGAGGTSPEVSERLQAIIAELEIRQKTREPALIKYRLTEFKSAEFLSPTRKRQIAASKPEGGPKPEARSITRSFDLALKGPKFFLTSTGPFHLSPAAFQKEAPSIWVFDGKNSYERLDDRYEVSTQPLKGRPMIPWDVTGENMFLRWLERWTGNSADKTGEQIQFDVRDEKALGEKGLVRVECRAAKGAKLLLWLQPDLGYAVLKAEQYSEAGTIDLRVDQCVYETVAGKAYPKKAVLTKYVPNNDKGSPIILMRTELEVQSIETDPNRIPDSLFRLEIPKDTPVFDRDTKTLLVDPKEIQEHLDRISGDTPGRRSKYWWASGLTLSCVALLIAYALWRRKRRRQPR